jgi:methionyl-tRNA formyltransferase
VPLRIVFCGTPEFAVPSLRHLIAHPEFQVQAVVTQPDRPSGRGREIHRSPVKLAAEAAGIPVFQPGKIRSDEAYDYFQRLAPDAVAIIAYGQIVPKRLIEIPRLGWINLHASLLPKYRGAAPINWAIANGETWTGLTTMLIDPGLDTGPMLLKREGEIGRDITAPQLTFLLSEWGGPLMAETLEKLSRGEIAPEPQDNSQATFAPPLKKEDGRIDWSLSAQKINDRIRGFDPWPGAFTTFLGKTCRIWGKPLFDPAVEAGLKSAHAPEAWVSGAILMLGREVFVSCGENTILQLEFVHLEGRKRVTAREFAFGVRLSAGECFGR